MPKVRQVATPIFYETLAAAAHCETIDAVEHLDAIENGNRRQVVADFLSEFSA